MTRSSRCSRPTIGLLAGSKFCCAMISWPACRQQRAGSGVQAQVSGELGCRRKSDASQEWVAQPGCVVQALRLLAHVPGAIQRCLPSSVPKHADLQLRCLPAAGWLAPPWGGSVPWIARLRAVGITATLGQAATAQAALLASQLPGQPCRQTQCCESAAKGMRKRHCSVPHRCRTQSRGAAARRWSTRSCRWHGRPRAPVSSGGSVLNRLGLACCSSLAAGRTAAAAAVPAAAAEDLGQHRRDRRPAQRTWNLETAGLRRCAISAKLHPAAPTVPPTALRPWRARLPPTIPGLSGDRLALRDHRQARYSASPGVPLLVRLPASVCLKRTLRCKLNAGEMPDRRNVRPRGASGSTAAQQRQQQGCKRRIYSTFSQMESEQHVQQTLYQCKVLECAGTGLGATSCRRCPPMYRLCPETTSAGRPRHATLCPACWGPQMNWDAMLATACSRPTATSTQPSAHSARSSAVRSCGWA